MILQNGSEWAQALLQKEKNVNNQKQKVKFVYWKEV